MAEFNFSNLTPEVILDAIESIGIYPESGLLALNSYENRVYQFKADDGKRYVVKFYRPERWTTEQLLEEHEFSLQLQADDIPVVPPLVHQGNSLFSHGGYQFCVFPSVGGRMFELDNLDQLEWLGRLLGRLHNSSAKTSFKHRLTVAPDAEFVDARQQLQQTELLPDYLRNTFFHELDRVAELTLQHWQHDYETIRLHGDCHAGNILWQSFDTYDDAILVDLDDCISGPAIQDFWMMLSGDRANQMLQLDTMVTAYEEFAEFDSKQLKLIEPLRARRMINYMAWLAKRWQDPAFERNFSWFATDKYWEQQVLALKEQLSALQEPPLKLGY